jgi:hypothetical protein
MRRIATGLLLEFHYLLPHYGRIVRVRREFQVSAERVGGFGVLLLLHED